MFWDDFIIELSVCSICFSKRIKSTVLFNSIWKWFRFIQNLSSSSLIIQFSHIFFSFICVLNVLNFLLESFICWSCHEILFSIQRSWVVVFIFLLMRKFRMSSHWSCKTTFEYTFWLIIFSKEILTCILIFITDCIWNQFIERFSDSLSSSTVSKILNSTNLLFWSPIFLIICRGISHCQWKSWGE